MTNQPTPADAVPIVRVIITHRQWGGDTKWTPGLWSVIAGGIGLWVAGFIFGPID